MMIAFANNQVMVAVENQTGTTIYTDPVPLGNNDRGTAIVQAHYMFGGTGQSLVYTAEVSNDGVTWIASSLTDSVSDTTPETKVAALNGVFVRFVFTFTVSGAGSATGGVCFDCHVNLDHI